MKLGVALLLSFLACIASGQQQTDAKPQPAVKSIIGQFDRYPVVMLGEIHGSIQFDQLLKGLVTAPSFAEHVNDIVVEMGNALHQPILDAYISGADTPLDQLCRVWQDVVGAPGGILLPPYHGLFATVREVNRRLPPEHKIRVLAGDPPIDWKVVSGREDVAPFLSFRDEHYGSVVRYQVLAKRRKALLIMGAGHFMRREGKPGLVEQQVLGSFAKGYVIIAGSDVVHTFDDVDARFAAVSDPAAPWVMPMKGTWVGALPRWSDSPLIGYPAPGSPGAKETGIWEDAADAYLYLGSRDQLTGGGEAFDLEGTPYGNELRRRWKILFPKPPETLPKSDGSVIPLMRRTPAAPPALRPAPR
jgi:hypothetical protein